jgi:hypothetical protein
MIMTKKILVLILVVCALTVCCHEIAFSQTPIGSSEEGRATFIQTLLKTPFALLSCVFTFIAIIVTGVFELFGYLFSGFNYKFPITYEVIDIGWKGIVKQWWWHPGVTWHLIVSLFLCIGILSGSRR